MLSRPESVGERAVGEDDAENSWRNSFTITEHLYVWALLRSRVKGWDMTRSLEYDSSYGTNGDHCNLRSAALIAFDIDWEIVEGINREKLDHCTHR